MHNNDSDLIRKLVHHYYWNLDINCARTTLLCLSELLDSPLEEQTLQAAIGMHGAGYYRAQCGLVEGALMFIGIFFAGKGNSVKEIGQICYRFADECTKRFSSLTCRDLRPGGFNDDDPPHLCEKLTVDFICFAHEFILSQVQ